jgi:hypothetical protein
VVRHVAKAARQRVKQSLRESDRHVRHATSRARMLPSFLIIGAQRAGTTSLYRYLDTHPDVVWPRSTRSEVYWSKELHFFDDRFWRGLGWYRAFFPLELTRRVARLRGQDRVAAEASPSYLFHPAVPERVAASLPDVRLIAVLRNPVDRAYSHYQLMLRLRQEQRSFAEALEGEEEILAEEAPRVLDPRYTSHRYRRNAYVAKGLYAEQLERWFAHFPRERLLVLSIDDLATRPDEIYADVLSFLDLRPHRPPRFGRHNRLPAPPLDPDIRTRLERRFAEPNARLEELLGRKLGWHGAPAAQAQETASG